MEKRYRLTQDPPELPLDLEQVVDSNLPIPREHPDVMLHTADYVPKTNFLRTIGLEIMPPHKREGKTGFTMEISQLIFNFILNNSIF